MADFNLQLAQTPVNPLLGYAAQSAAIRNQSGAQDLADRATLRGLASGLAANDPNAGAQAATVAGGPVALAGLAGMHEDQRRSLANTLDTYGAIGGAILAAPAEQRPALWQAFHPTLVQAGVTGAPQDYPGSDVLSAHRTAALGAGKQIELIGSQQTSNPNATVLDPPPSDLPGAGGQPRPMSQAAPSGVTDDYASAVIGGESGGNPTATNPRSSATGAGQFTDGTWLGLLPIVRPDLASLPPQQQLALRNDPNISRQMVVGYAQQNAPVLQSAGIPVTPTTLAVAHGFGAQGATRVLKADPATPMEALYPPTVQNGQQVPNPVMIANPQYAGKTAGQVVQTYSTRMAGVGGGQQAPAPQRPQPVQTASLTGTAGMPATATDVVADDDGEEAQTAPTPAPTVMPATKNAQGAWQLPPNAPPGSSIDVDENGNATVSIPAASAPAAAPVTSGVSPAVDGALARARIPQPLVSAPNALLSAAPQGAPPMQRNALMPDQLAAPQQTAQAAFGAAPPGTKPLYNKLTHAFIPTGTPGYIMGITPDGQRAEMRAPGSPGAGVETKEVGGSLISTDKQTGAVVRNEPGVVPDTRRATSVDDGNNIHVMQGDKEIATIPHQANPALVQTQIYKEDREAVQPLIQQGQDAQQAQIRTRAMRDAFAANPSGAGADAKVNLVNWVQSLFGDGAATEAAKKLTGVNSVADAQEAAKLALVNAGSQERGTLGARGSLGAIKLYQSANPNIALQPDAIKKISNMQLIAQQADADFAEGAAKHVLENGQKLTNNQGYEPMLAYDHEWQSSRPSQVYAAAMGALNGDPFEKWSKNLSPDEGKRVVGILTRADPGAAIQWKGGATFHVPSGN